MRLRSLHFIVTLASRVPLPLRILQAVDALHALSKLFCRCALVSKLNSILAPGSSSASSPLLASRARSPSESVLCRLLPYNIRNISLTMKILCIYIYIYIYVYIYIYIYICWKCLTKYMILEGVGVRIYIYMYVYICLYICVYISIYIYIYMCVCIYFIH